MATAALVVPTAALCDVVGGGSDPWPNGNANTIDIGVVVDYIKGVNALRTEPRTWMKNPPDPDLKATNVIDLGHTINALKGLPYPYDIPSCP